MDIRRKQKVTTRALESEESLTKRLRNYGNVDHSDETRSLPSISNPETREGSQVSAENTERVEEDINREEINEEVLNKETEPEDVPEDSQAKLDTLFKTFKSPIYVCFHPPKFSVENGHEFQVFQCGAKKCLACDGRLMKRNLNTQNATSTSNLKKHASRCWGDELVKALMAVKSIHEA
ncbi:hypothetical protein AGABI1DRAFT_126923 [Agaricus bisporus var. burnettii JB137-S8]|uniref:Uncharacterized protein n=1 Tax=Agaricus bisporus var. burnettii (strain JB137-S8 / ATCC MYA-4627 / FGSC 10392) TaxID=597362 RepID=K5XCM6_AGABU|nr:uncharacterized protein AGABI1DRAFT_126923 [Agaricus bisporus var. burnettii JB137-S8]EKM80872.1 hypothetical protein AGABI1DRAFT_126923 [Agaricus bisporus var. burnettii JB137-S8]